MKFAFVIDDYLPMSTKVGAKMFHELAVEFVANGHEVIVITPCDNQKKKLNKFILDGVNVWTFKSGKIKNISKVIRLINESLLSFNAWKAIRNEEAINNIDGIVYYSPSIFWGELIKKIKERSGADAYLVLRDLFPRWAIDLNIIKEGSLLEKYFRFFEKKSYDQTNKIGLMSENNLNIFNERFKKYTCEVLNNWTTESLSPIDHEISFRKKLNISDDKIIYFYGGNIGHAQDMINLMRLANNMKDYPNAHFLFVGNGDEVQKILSFSKENNLDNFTYLPSISQFDFNILLSEVDVGLFSLSKLHQSSNFPGKLLGYMSHSLPILGSINDGNDVSDVIMKNSAGLICINGEDKILLSNAISLLDEKVRKNLGKNSNLLLKMEFSSKSAFEKIICFFEHKIKSNVI